MAVNPTRMELLKLGKRFILARRGYKMLKDKQEEILHRFLKLIEENKGYRKSLEEKLVNAATRFLLIQSTMPEEILEEVLIKPEVNLEATISPEKVQIFRFLILL